MSSSSLRLPSHLTLAIAALGCGMCLLVACRDDDAPVAPLPDAGLDSALVDASSDGALPDAGSRPRRSPDGGRPSSMACGSTIRPAG